MVSFGVFGFLYLRFLLLSWEECGGVYKTGRRRIGWAAPSLGARKEMLTSLSRLFFHLHFPSSSLLFIPFVRLFWRSSSCPLARAQLSPVHPRIRTRFVSTAHAFSPQEACCCIIISDCVVKRKISWSLIVSPVLKHRPHFL
jgi:hypothetical protein